MNEENDQDVPEDAEAQTDAVSRKPMKVVDTPRLLELADAADPEIVDAYLGDDFYQRVDPGVDDSSPDRHLVQAIEAHERGDNEPHLLVRVEFRSVDGTLGETLLDMTEADFDSLPDSSD